MSLAVVKSLDDAFELKRWLSEQQYVAVDTETSSTETFDPAFRVRLLQLGNANSSWVMPFERWVGLADELLTEFSRERTIVMHNARFDIAALASQGVHIPWHAVDDTMIALRLVEPQKLAGLKPAATRHISAAAGASQKALNDGMRKNGWTWATVPLDFEPYVYYAAMDTVLTARLFEHNVVKEGLASPVYNLEMDVRALCSRMEERGMRIDRRFCAERSNALRDEAERLKTEATDRLGVSLTSTQSIARWLMADGATLTRLTPAGAPSVDKETLDQLLHDPSLSADARWVVNATIRVRKCEKLASSYFDNFISMADADDIVHPSIETVAARTGRMSVRSPALQTLPRVSADPDSKLVRQAVIGRADGEVLVSCDYSQIELRQIASFSADPGLIEAFGAADSGSDDFFTAATRAVYEDDAIIKSDDRRATVKSLFYAACPHPDTRVLCDDLIWRRAGDLVVGQGLWGFDEHQNDHPHPRARSRKWRHSVVTGADHEIHDSVKITLESGKELVCARDHYWLTQNGGVGAKKWTRAEDLRVGVDGITKYIEPWETEDTREAGWLAGIMEGEGSLCRQDQAWRITQLPGGVADRIEEALTNLGVAFHRNVHPTSGCYNWYPAGGRVVGSLSLLGRVQATRLIEKVDLDGKTMWRLPIEKHGCDRVVSVEPAGMQPVVVLSTSTATYLAEGYGSHNSYGAGITKMAYTAGVTVDEMRKVHGRVFSRYPGLGMLMKHMERVCKEQDGWIVTPAGRRVWVDPDRAYAAVNGLVQASAADTMKQAIVRLGHAGLEEMMVVPVHDEMLVSCAAEDVDDVKHILETSMLDETYAVPLYAEPSDGYETWGAIPK